MSRIKSVFLVFFVSGLLLIVVWSGTEANGFARTLAASDVGATASASPCYWNTVPFGVDDWIISAPTGTILSNFAYENQTYPALVATHFGQGKAVFAVGSVFSEIDNLAAPHHVKQAVFLNAARWVTNDQPPTQTLVLVTYGHRELVTYDDEWGKPCCTSNVILALEDAGYTVEVTSDIPITLTQFGAVIMPGVGWHETPQYPNPIYWSGDAGHAPTAAEVTALLNFVKNGGGLMASAEFNLGAAWLTPIGQPMSVTFGSITDNGTIVQSNRVANHLVMAKDCQRVYLPEVSH